MSTSNEDAPLLNAVEQLLTEAKYANTTTAHAPDLAQEELSVVARLAHPAGIAAAILLLCYTVVGLVGNALTVMALLRRGGGREGWRGRGTVAFIISLCCADMLCCAVVLPWEAGRFLARRWPWGDGLVCTLLPLLRYWNVATSLLSITMITISRYILIACPRLYVSVYKTEVVAVMVAVCWLLPLALLTPTLLGMWGHFGHAPSLATCSIIAEPGERPKEALFLLGFCVPALVITACYGLIYMAVRRSERRVRDHRDAAEGKIRQYRVGSDGGSNGTGFGGSGGGGGVSGGGRRSSEWRVTMMVLTVFVAFIITYLPITLVKTFDSEVRSPLLHMMGYVLVYVSCCVNPVIYVLMNRQYREAYRNVIRCGTRTDRMNHTAATRDMTSACLSPIEEQRGIWPRGSYTAVPPPISIAGGKEDDLNEKSALREP